MASTRRRLIRSTSPEIYFIDNSTDSDTDTDDGGSDASEEDEYRVDLSEEEEGGDEYEEVHGEGDEDYEPYIPMNPSPRVSEARPTSTAPGQAEACKGRRREEGEADSMPSSRSGTNQGGCAGGESSQSETDAMCCPICFQPWTSGGDHHVCCLPCGHIYGMSCIIKWLQHCKRSAKCPQCNKKCALKDIRKLYTTSIVAVDNGSQKEVEFLKTKCASLKAKCASLETKAADWFKTEDFLRQQVDELTKRTTYLERSLKYSLRRPFGFTNSDTDCQGQSSGHDCDSDSCMHCMPCTFLLQEEFKVDGARLFDVDVSGATLIVAQRLSGMGGMHSLSKMSLITHERENIQLPSDTKSIKDLRVSPAGGLALLASLGKKLSVLSLDSNNMILTYDLPAPAWSCAWNRNSSHNVYAGLQNGMILVFDMRQTAKPMESLIGPTCNPVHTVHPLLNDATRPSGVTRLITASSVGLCKWTFGGSGKGPYLIPGTENQGVCISLAASPSSNNIVATFRPKVLMSDDSSSVSQSFCSPRTSTVGQGIRGTHVLFKQTGDQCYRKSASAIANVNDIRFPRSVIIDSENQNSVFASGDDVSNEMVLHELPSLDVSQHLKPHAHPISDVRYTDGIGLGLLGCLSENKLQLFCPDLQWTH